MQVETSCWPRQCENSPLYQFITKGKSYTIGFDQELVSFSIDLELRYDLSRFSDCRFVIIELADANFKFDPIFINPVGRPCLAIKGTREFSAAQKLRKHNTMYDLYRSFYIYGLAGDGSRIDISTKSSDSINYDIVFNIAERATN